MDPLTRSEAGSVVTHFTGGEAEASHGDRLPRVTQLLRIRANAQLPAASRHFRRNVRREVEVAQGACEGPERKPLVGQRQRAFGMLEPWEGLGWILPDVGVRQEPFRSRHGEGAAYCPQHICFPHPTLAFLELQDIRRPLFRQARFWRPGRWRWPSNLLHQVG